MRIVFSTSGDGYPQAAATLMEKPLSALTRADLDRLGEVRETEAIKAAQILGLTGGDLVFLRYPDAGLARLPAERRAHAERDVRRVLEESRPSRAYVTDRADEHPDHQVTNDLVFDAAASVGYEGELFTFVVHAGGDMHWPAPGATYETQEIDGVAYPKGVDWPPPIRLPLTPRESDVKLEALKAHTSQWALDHEYLGKFVKSEEVFWHGGRLA